MARRKHPLSSEPQTAHITDLTHSGQGVARVDGKTVFVNGALPGEDIEFVFQRRRRQFDEGKLHRIITASPERVEPRCRHFGICGGCNLQHLRHESQVTVKQKILLDNLQRIGHVNPENILPPITGEIWGYRRKARLGVRLVEKKGKVLVGFRETASRYLADLSRCEVLVPEVGNRLEALAGLVASLSAPTTIPQIEIAFGDVGRALVFRHLEPLSEQDQQKLIEFGKRTELDIYLQPKGPDSIHALWPQQPVLQYQLPVYDLKYDFLPSDFVQVNAGINRQMVASVLDLLQLSPDMHVLELFCGLGNFTLPIAQKAASVVAVEGEPGLIERAKINAGNNGIENVSYCLADLMDDIESYPFWKQGRYDRVFLDPPRSGAEAVVNKLGLLKISRIVYVSCNPSTLARDSDILVNRFGYHLLSAGIMDMFPHTAHVESIAVFTR